MGKSLSSQKGINPPTRDVNAVQRVALALQLRSTKMTYAEIAKQCGYATPDAARKAVMRELDRCVVRNVDLLRNEELDSLDRLERECWKRLANKDYEKSMLFAVDRIVAIKERRCKLLGLDQSAKEAAIGNVVLIREVPAGLLVSE